MDGMGCKLAFGLGMVAVAAAVAYWRSK